MTFDARRHWRGLIAAVLAAQALLLFAPGWIATPDLQEKRALAAAPQAPRGLGDLTAFRKAADVYVADHFPARTHLIAGLNWLRMQAAVSGSERVIVGRGGWLFYDDDTHLGAARGDPPLTGAGAYAWLGVLAGRTEALASRGIAYLVVVPPVKETVYPHLAPGWFRGRGSGALTPGLSRLARASGAGEVLDLGPPLARYAGYGLKVFSAEDTHWTGLGAYLGYANLMNRLKARGIGSGPRPLEAFTEAPDESANRPRDLSLMLGVASFSRNDYPRFADLDSDARRNTTYLSANRSWTGPQVVETGMAGKPVLLMTRDSFSNALMPFLHGDFSRIILAHNQDGEWRMDLVERYRPDVVVLEVMEGGVAGSMTHGPSASAPARVRIAAAIEAAGLGKAGAVAPQLQFPRAVSTPMGALVISAGCRALSLAGVNNDQITCGGADDTAEGRVGDDVIDGGGGGDILKGGRGNDRVFGGDGDDWVSGDRGDDTVSGGRGADVFHAAPGAGLDRILDFSAADGDQVEIEPGGAYEVVAAGPDTEVRFATGARVVLAGVAKASLGPHSIIMGQGR